MERANGGFSPHVNSKGIQESLELRILQRWIQLFGRSSAQNSMREKWSNKEENLKAQKLELGEDTSYCYDVK